MHTLNLSTTVLNWAAHQIGESYASLVDGLARRDKERERLYEGCMTMAQAEKFSKITGVPFGLLFLPEPPVIARPAIPDLRQTPQARQLVKFSRDFQEAYEDALRKQRWYTSYLEEGGKAELPFVGKFTNKSQADVIARDITNLLGVSTEMRAKCRTPEDYFSALATRAEQLGVLVMKSGIVKSNTHRPLSVQEFRGFAIADRRAPLVFVNGRDAEVAAVFTLLHELAHIWVGESGVSDLTLTSADESNVERLCNLVAAEVLVPKAEFMEAWAGIDQISVTASKFRVSRVVIARRALAFQKISRAEYMAVAEMSAKRPASAKSGGNPYATIPVRNSKRLTYALVKSVMAGETLIREASSLLNVRPDTVMELGRREAGIG